MTDQALCLAQSPSPFNATEIHVCTREEGHPLVAGACFASAADVWHHCPCGAMFNTGEVEPWLPVGNGDLEAFLDRVVQQADAYGFEAQAVCSLTEGTAEIIVTRKEAP